MLMFLVLFVLLLVGKPLVEAGLMRRTLSHNLVSTELNAALGCGTNSSATRTAPSAKIPERCIVFS